MNNSDLSAEISDLCARLEKIKSERLTRESLKNMEENVKENFNDFINLEHELSDVFDVENLVSDLEIEEIKQNLTKISKEWLHTVSDDIQQIKPVSFITIFGLGILVGRLWSK